jgi:adenine-specific DNA methylase
MACRRRPENAPIGWYAQVRAELERIIPERLSEFWRAGIRGADFFVSAIGPAVGVFGRYRKVMRPDGREITVSDLLDEARGIVTAFALEQLGLARLDEPTRFYILYRWAYGGEELSFDEANKLAKSAGAELDALAGLALRRKDTVRIPSFAERWEDHTCLGQWQRALKEGEVVRLPEIDHLHIALGLWHKGDTESLAEFFRRGGVQHEEHPFWRTAQALLEIESESASGALEKEARALSQLLGSKRGLMRHVSEQVSSERQLRLFE